MIFNESLWNVSDHRANGMKLVSPIGCHDVMFGEQRTPTVEIVGFPQRRYGEVVSAPISMFKAGKWVWFLDVTFVKVDVNICYNHHLQGSLWSMRFYETICITVKHFLTLFLRFSYTAPTNWLPYFALIGMFSEASFFSLRTHVGSLNLDLMMLRISY